MGVLEKIAGVIVLVLAWSLSHSQYSHNPISNELHTFKIQSIHAKLRISNSVEDSKGEHEERSCRNVYNTNIAFSLIDSLTDFFENPLHFNKSKLITSCSFRPDLVLTFTNSSSQIIYLLISEPCSRAILYINDLTKMNASVYIAKDQMKKLLVLINSFVL